MNPNSDVPTRTDVVVVGAGLAGLNAARELRLAGVDVTVLEGAEEVGGRVATDRVDGRLLDRGFQLYNPAYPEARRVLDHDRLDLRPFGRGARVLRRDGAVVVADPRTSPRQTLGMLRGFPGGLLAGARFARYAASCAYTDMPELVTRPDLPIEAVLRNDVRSRQLMESLLRPFLAGVFGEWDLATSRRYADLVLRSFVRGTPSLPAHGMAQIPLALARDIGPGVIKCGVPVLSVGPREVRHSGGTVSARAVIVATDGASASQLVPSVPRPRFNALTTWYFAAPAHDVGHDPTFLMIDGDRRGILANIAAISAVVPAYSPAGETLVAATAVGRYSDDAAAREHLRLALGDQTRHWPLVSRYEIPHALPAFPVGTPLRAGQSFADVLVAGDHRDTPSIQGALVSGRRAARAAVKRLGGVPE